MAKNTKNTLLISATTVRTVKKFHQILEQGDSDIDAQGDQGSTALMIACHLGKKTGAEMATALVQSGADVNIARPDEMTALKYAAKYSELDVIHMLLDHGAEIDGPKGTKQTAFILAARANRPEVLELLYERGADINYACKLRWAEGRNALGIADMEKRYKAVKYLKTIMS
jgi:ankyrin repeat protein